MLSSNTRSKAKTWSLTFFDVGRTERPNLWTGLSSGGSKTLWTVSFDLGVCDLDGRVQTTVVDDLDHTSNTALVKHGRGRSGQRTVTEKDRSIIVLLSAIQLAIIFTVLPCQTYNCAASRIVKGRTRTKITVNKSATIQSEKSAPYQQQ